MPGARIIAAAGIAAELPSFTAAWDDLSPDPYLKEEPPYRFRRHGRARFDPGAGSFTPLPPGEYLQAAEHNPLFGGVHRTFAPITWDGATTHVLGALVRRAPTGVLAPDGPTLINFHQIRIIGGPGYAGTPVPEGRHRDGFDVIAIHLIGRDLDGGGETTVVPDDGGEPTRLTLTDPMDAVYLDDRRFTHHTTAIESNGRPVHRDVLLTSFERERR